MKEINGKTIVLAGGGTAGHVLPCVALLPLLFKHYSNIYYIGGTNEGERKIIENEGIRFYQIKCVKLRRGFDLNSFAKNIGIPFGFIQSVRDAGKILDELKPDIVFSKGGYVALPVVMAARRRNIPVVAHESDASMGLANRLSTRACDRVCMTFPTERPSGKFVYTGSPIRQKIYLGDKGIIKARHFGGDDDGKKNLLVLGGSLGAKNINKAVWNAADMLLKRYNIVHICGKGKTHDGFAHTGYVQIEFAKDVENYMAWADVVVSRAGSNTLCELMVLGKPVIFVPLGTGRGDQIENAEIVKKNNAGIVLPEYDLNAESLVQSVDRILYDTHIVARAKDLVKDGTDKIVEILCNVSKVK